MSAISNGNIEVISEAKISSYTTKWYKHFGSAFDFHVDQLNNFSDDSEWVLALRLKALHNHLAIALVKAVAPNEAMIDCMLQHFPESKSLGEFTEIAEDVDDGREDVITITQPALSVDQFLFHKIEGDSGEIEADSIKTTLTIIGDGVDIQFTFSNKTIKFTVPVADFVKRDGTVPFTATQTGVAAVENTDLVIYSQVKPFITQIVYLDPAAGDDATGAINNSTLKFATLRAAVDALSSAVGYVIIEEDAVVAETLNALDGLNNAVIELYIQGGWDSMRFITTRPFQILSPSLRKFELNRTGTNGHVELALSTYSIFCDAGTTSRIKEININVGVVTFNGTVENQNLFTTSGTDLQANIVCDEIINASIGTARLGSGKINVVVNGDVTTSIGDSITASVFEIRDGNHDISIEVKGVIDITAFDDSRHSVVNSLSTASSGSSIVIKGDIVTTTTRTTGLFNFSGNYLTKSFTYSGKITGSGTTALFFASSAAGNFKPVINLINVNKVLSGPLVQQGGTGDFEVNVINCRTVGTAFILTTTSDIAYFKVSSLYVQGATAFLLSTNRVDTEAIEFYGHAITVYSTGTAAAELLAADSSTDFVGTGSLTAISTNIASRFDDNKFDIIELDDFETLAGTLALGNITGGKNIVFTAADLIDMSAANPGQDLLLFPSSAKITHIAAGAFNWFTNGIIWASPAGSEFFKITNTGVIEVGSITEDGSIKIWNSTTDKGYTISTPDITDNRFLTLPDGDVDFTGGSELWILTQQADGSFAPQAITIDDLTDGILYERYNDTKAKDAGSDTGTSFPASPSNGKVFFRSDIGMEFKYDGHRSKWLSEHTREIDFYSNAVTSAASTVSLSYGGVDRFYVTGPWRLVGMVIGNQALTSAGNVIITNDTDSTTTHTESYTAGEKNNFNLDIAIAGSKRYGVDITPSADVQKPTVTLLLKYNPS
jgi:hypothetical protein